MMKKIFFTGFWLILALGGACAVETLEPFEKNERILILAPHPDDEAIGCAGVIQQARAAGANVRVVYLTNGDHNQFAFIVYKKSLVFTRGEFIQMGELRRREAIKAMELLGLNKNGLVFLGYPDFGTFTIFSQYWQAKSPFMSFLTRISSVPYKEDFTFGAPYVGESILADLKKTLLDYKPARIFVSHPADVNGDHKALYLFLQIALADLNQEIPRPKIYPYLIHCVGWPTPRHYHPELSLEVPVQFLSAEMNWLEFKLTPEQLGKKHAAILCYRSQTHSSAFYLLSFARKNELFGVYPEIELVMPVAAAFAKGAEKAASKNELSWFSLLSGMFAEISEEWEGNLDLEKSIEIEDRVSYALKDDFLFIRLRKAKESSYRRAVATFYLFGYNYKTPFDKMPKIRIVTKYQSFNIFSSGKVISPENTTLEVSKQELILKVPLSLLGEPNFILASMRAYTGSLPVYTTGFHKINIIRRK